MLINFGKYIFNDGIRGINGGKPKMEYASPSNNTNNASNVNQQSDYGIYQQYAFNETYYNNLLNQGKLKEALDYITQYKPIDEGERRKFEAEIATLRQDSKYQDNFKSSLTEDQNNRYSFYSNLFESNGFDGREDNPYVKKFIELKNSIGNGTHVDKNGKVTPYNAAGLSLYLPSPKRYFLGQDWLAPDATADIDHFLEYSKLTKDALKEAGVKIQYDDKGSAYIKFNKSNDLANELLYKYIDFYRKEWGDTNYRPMIQSLDEDDNVIANNVIPFTRDYHHNLYQYLNGQVRNPHLNDIDTSNKLKEFYNLIDENKNVSEELNKLYDLKSETMQNYTSIEADFMSDEMEKYMEMCVANGVDMEKMIKGLNYYKALAIDQATRAMTSNDYDFYTSYYNESEADDTLEKIEDPERIGEILKRLNNANKSNVVLTTLISNGKIGTKISLPGLKDKNGNTTRGLQVWIPGLFSEEAQEKLNRDPESRAALEANTILDTNSSYMLRDGSKISADDSGNFYVESGKLNVNGHDEYLNAEPLSKEDVVLEIQKDLIIDNLVDTQFNKHIGIRGNVLNVEKYDEEAKELAIDVAQKLFPGQDDLVKPDGTLFNAEEVFNRVPQQDNVSPYVYKKIKTIYDVYDALMKELFQYEDFTDSLFESNGIRYSYAANT